MEEFQNHQPQVLQIGCLVIKYFIERLSPQDDVC